MERELTRLGNLKQNRDISPDELMPIARLNILCREFKANPLFSDDKEQKMAETRFRTYLDGNQIESASDIDTLKSLIYNEVFEIRIQGELNKLAEDGKYPPDKLIKSLTDVQNQKSALKIKLGIDRKEEEKNDLSVLQLLQKRFHTYIQEHKNEFTLKIPFKCSKCKHEDVAIHLLRRRVENFDVIKHPWFAGNWFFNFEIIKDVKDGKLTRQDAWRYLCSATKGSDSQPAFTEEYCTDYINYCIENWTSIVLFLENKNNA